MEKVVGWILTISLLELNLLDRVLPVIPAVSTLTLGLLRVQSLPLFCSPFTCQMVDPLRMPIAYVSNLPMIQLWSILFYMYGYIRLFSCRLFFMVCFVQHQFVAFFFSAVCHLVACFCFDTSAFYLCSHCLCFYFCVASFMQFLDFIVAYPCQFANVLYIFTSSFFLHFFFFLLFYIFTVSLFLRWTRAKKTIHPLLYLLHPSIHASIHPSINPSRATICQFHSHIT